MFKNLFRYFFINYSRLRKEAQFSNVFEKDQNNFKMFSVIKSEKKMFESYIESIPDIWFRGKNADKYFLCPENVSKQQFCNAARNCFHPMANWQKIKCQILESRFSK